MSCEECGDCRHFVNNKEELQRHSYRYPTYGWCEVTNRALHHNGWCSAHYEPKPPRKSKKKERSEP